MVAAGRWQAAASHAEAGKLLALAELIRRNPGTTRMASAGQMPAVWELGTDTQAALELAVSPGAGDVLLGLAWALAVRLPLTLRALAAGMLDMSKVRMIIDTTSILSDELAGEAERALSGYWAGRTWSQIHARLTRIVCDLDPDAVQRKREQAQQHDARVRVWREASGTCGLGGFGLPPDEALMANTRIQARALAYRKAGLDGSMDLLRVRAYLDILNGTDARDALPADDGADGGDDGHGDGPGGDSDGPGSGDGGQDGGYGDGLAANVDLTLPLRTLMGLAERSGEADWLGAADPALVRDLGTAAARNRRSTFRIIITGPDGRAVAFGTARERRRRRTRRGNPPPTATRTPAGPADQPAAPENGGSVNQAGKTGTAGGTGTAGEAGAGGHGAGFGFAPAPGQAVLPLDGLPGRADWGTWRLTAAGRTWDITLTPIPAPGPCDHRHRTPAYRPGDTLRHLVQIRDGHCALPACHRPARTCEWEHAIPWPHRLDGVHPL